MRACVVTHHFYHTIHRPILCVPKSRFTTPGIVAQLVERALCMREVPRSKLGSSTFFWTNYACACESARTYP